MKKKPHTSQAAIGRALGLSPAAVHKNKRMGMPVDSVEAARRWRQDNIALTAHSLLKPDPPSQPLVHARAPMPPARSAAADPTYQAFRSRREQAEAQIAEMNAAKMKGVMLMRDDVDRAMFEIGRELRDQLTSCARRVAAEVSSLTTAESCEVVIDREHRIVLELLVTSLREKSGAGPKVAA